MPGAVLLPPIAGRLPAFRLHDGPAVRQPERRRRVAAGVDEFEPFGVADEMARDAHLGDQFVVPRRLVVEAKAVAVVADRMNARGHIDKTARTVCRARRLPAGVVNRIGRVLREGVQDVGEQQFLVLLLVMQADFDNREDAAPPRPPARSRSAARPPRRHGRDRRRRPRRSAA